MSSWNPEVDYSLESFKKEATLLLTRLKDCGSLEQARENAFDWVAGHEYDPDNLTDKLLPGEIIRRRDCVRAFMSIIKPSSDKKAGFSVTQAIWDIARGQARTDLQAGFFAEIINMIMGIEGRSLFSAPDESKLSADMSGREASKVRSDELDKIWEAAAKKMAGYADGLTAEAIQRRQARSEQIIKALGGQSENWDNWRWHVQHVLTDAESVAKVVGLSDSEKDAILRANKCNLAFGITPYYASLMDQQPSSRDRAIRAQVLPPTSYVAEMEKHRSDRGQAFDFMGEYDTSPIDLVTRRYPAILILKPYNTCPQICVYCQRNWEIDQAMAPGAMASEEKIEAALQWIEEHSAIREVLITGGDPLIMSNERIEKILSRIAAIDHIDLIRIGSRVPVTIPMRITQNLADLLGKFRQPGRREVCLVTHVEHPYEITPQMVTAVDRIKRQGISVFNQQVYTFFTSRRFEAARLRMLLRRIGIDPYYTFVTKGKEETGDYRVPIARLLQEQKE
ncbi:MAG: KamA family radical SAM protein, partial [Deltaproteobacteria bacterium]|nr:KamA family radical SAM protein [Deltaproteobacteria bacterium]